MPTLRTIGLAAALALAASPPVRARAQAPEDGPSTQGPPGRLALTVATPTTLGLLWHLGDRLAIRPEFSGVHTIGTGLLPTTGLAGAVALLRYAGGDGPTRTYLTPRLLAQLAYTDGGDDFVTWGASLSFGAQHHLGDTRLMVFAEGGLQALWYRRDFGLAGRRSLTQVSTRTVVGLGWYPGRG